MSLWTVMMQRLRLVSTFDTAGNKVDDRVERIPVTLHDLPLKTALSYKQNGEPGTVQIVEQFGSFGDAKERVKGGFRKREVVALLARKGGKSRSVAEAAESGDLAAAINAEVES